MSRRANKGPMTFGQIVSIYGFDADIEYPNSRPTAAMLADRDKRYYATPRSITSWVMGDPPPGYSALDRK